MGSVIERFTRYIRYDTRSDENTTFCPSNRNELALGRSLVWEMQQMGMEDVRWDDYGYIYGTVPGDPSLPVVGLIAHMDTAPDMCGLAENARIVHYQGGDIVLNEQKGIVLREQEFASLSQDRGKHLIVTDGTTLLGADDKAGIAEILTCAERLLQQKGKHATLKIAFTPDEEIGRGADLFDVAGFGADYAYTVDGGKLGELEYENFNAASAKITIQGLNIHPGSAKDKMINSQELAMEFHNMLPAGMRPEHTEGYEGFYHLIGMEGTVEQTVLRYIIRDHDRLLFQRKKALMEKNVQIMNEKYGAQRVTAQIDDSYYNMREKIQPHMQIIERAKQAMEAEGVKPEIVPIRGGTDGARLSFMGLPCPNLCTGGKNFHGRYEYIAVEDMEKMVDILVRLLTDF